MELPQNRGPVTSILFTICNDDMDVGLHNIIGKYADDMKIGNTVPLRL